MLPATEPMEVVLHNVSKRYRFEWIFKGIDFTFQAGQRLSLIHI